MAPKASHNLFFIITLASPLDTQHPIIVIMHSVYKGSMIRSSVTISTFTWFSTGLNLPKLVIIYWSQEHVQYMQYSRVTNISIAYHLTTQSISSEVETWILTALSYLSIYSKQ